MGKNYFMGEPLPKGGRPAMLVAGHSWAEGTFRGHEAEIGNALGMEVVARTKVGSGIDYARGEVGKADGDYRCALLFTGINDYSRAAGETGRKFDAAIDAALSKASGRVYVVNVPYYDAAGKGRIDDINRHLKSRAEKDPRIIYVDLNAELNGKKHPEYSPSELHPANYKGVREFLIREIGRNEGALANSEGQKAAR
ncbi:MAG: hypothetical protein WC263_04435 [Candidatus Micrarchaeia archaeon]|jgi:hypothetical protein